MKDKLQQIDNTIETFRVSQHFDLTRMIESSASEVDLPTAMGEIIDNALDQTLPGEPCEVLITLDSREDKIYFENRNTKGMENTDFQSFMTWGLRHENSIYGEHGQGGKLAIVQLLEKKTGNLIITSQPANSLYFKRMEVRGWWKKLEQGQLFDVQTSPTQQINNKGFTRIALEGLKENTIPTNLSELADNIGFTYSPLIKGQRLNVLLRRISKSGKFVDSINVVPVEIQFGSDQQFEKKGVPVKQGKMKFDIQYGMIDAAKKEKDKTIRGNLYQILPANVFEPDGESIYIFNRGRLHEKIPLSALKIFRTRRWTFAGFAAFVNITEGKIERTLLKKGLSPSSPDRHLILEKIKTVIEPFIQTISKESDLAISEKDANKVRDASAKFGTVLLGIFGNQQSKIFEEFFLRRDIVQESAKENLVPKIRPNTVGGILDRDFTLPGIKGQQIQRDHEIKIKRLEDPIPELRIASFGKDTPVAELTRDVDTGRAKLVIAINYDNPKVKLVLQTRGNLGVAYLLEIAAIAMYQRRWIEISPRDSELFIQGVERDVAKFLKKADELKII